MGATIVRQWLVLTMLPKPPRRIDSGTIETRLRARGVEVHRRTIQRDLVELAEVFPIIADERAKPFGWRWADGAEAVQVPSVTCPASRTLEVSLRLRRTEVPAVLERLRAGSRRLVDDGVDGAFTTLFTSVEDSACLRRRLFGLVAEVEVIGPAKLRQEVLAFARRALAIHEASP